MWENVLKLKKKVDNYDDKVSEIKVIGNWLNDSNNVMSTTMN